VFENRLRFAQWIAPIPTSVGNRHCSVDRWTSASSTPLTSPPAVRKSGVFEDIYEDRAEQRQSPVRGVRRATREATRYFVPAVRDLAKQYGRDSARYDWHGRIIQLTASDR
jgi:hypothetical protein